MVKLLQMLQGDVEYFGLLFIKSSDPQSKGVMLLQCTMKSPISMYHEWFPSYEIGCK